ncbi:retrovirus-related pol polyprotein from transposon TNT 1-94 [Tanacetum coccineum]
MWNLIQNGPYKRPMIPDADGVVNLNGTVKQVLEPLSKMTEGNDAAIRLFSVFFHEMIKYGKGKCSVYNYNERGHYASDCQETRVCDAKYFKRTNICLDMERWMPEATSTTNENYFMLDTSYVEKTMEELGYKNPERLKNSIAAQLKMYDGEKLHSTKLVIDSPDSAETLKDAEESRLKMRNKMKNEMLNAELERSSNDSKDIQANLLKRIKVRENDFKQSQAQSIDFELKLQHQKEKIACDVSWKSKLSTTNDENVLQKLKSKPVTSHPPPKNEQSQKQNENVLARGMYRITKTRTQTPDSKTNINVSNSAGLGHNLFSVRQFCNGDLEVAFCSNTCYVWNLEGDDLFTDSHDSNLYTVYVSEMAASSLVCLMSRATSTKSWLWHRRLSHLNFETINQLMSKDLVDGLSKFKYNKDHLCLACEQGKSKRASLPPKLVTSTESKLELLHMDLCGPMRVDNIK